MPEFFRFPHTPHLAWLGNGLPRDDKVLGDAEVRALLGGRVLVEEKLDGANIGLSLDEHGEIHVQNRGQYLEQPYLGQFSRLAAWLGQHGEALQAHITADLIVFGEWCAARHTLAYGGLPDWFLLFDVYSRADKRFWSTARRDSLASAIGLSVVPRVFEGVLSRNGAKDLLMRTTSAFGADRVEGIVIRREGTHWCESRAKLIRADFTQAIGDHWRTRRIEWNRQTGS
jgi:ATP-dependent RNA circularization protein (DNA/RNA ligase family)